MRIVAGRFRGRALTPVGKGDPAAHLRPTSDRVREAVFNILEGGRFGDPFGGVVLDLFAGTGALGLEALSRGCSSAVFVENGRKSLSLLKANIKILGAEAETQVVSRDARKLAENDDVKAGLVFLDPPYGKNLGAPVLEHVAAQGYVAEGALIVWEETQAQQPPDGFDLLEHRKYGDTTMTLLRYSR